MRLTYYGHACFLLDTQGRRILFDPFIRPNPLAAHVDVDSIEADYILVTHGHADHVADAVEIAKRTGAMVVSNFEIVNWFAGQGISNGHPMNHGGRWTFDFGEVKYVNAVHTSSMPDGSYGGAPGGFVISNDEGTLYHAGDTALTCDMKLLSEEYQVTRALLPIGDNFTMGVRDAVSAAGFIGCSEIIGMHYDTFDVIRIDHESARRAFESAGRNLTLMEIGQTMEW